MHNSNRNVFIIAVLLVAFFSSTLSVFLLKDDQKYDPRVEYCDMVGLYKSTNGESGWPDYRNIYYKECK